MLPRLRRAKLVLVGDPVKRSVRTLLHATVFIALHSLSAHGQSTTALSAQGWYADPEAHIFAGQYWVYPTSSLTLGDAQAGDFARGLTTLQQGLRNGPLVMKDYLLQTGLDAFSSPDLVHWMKHPHVLSVQNVPWAAYAVWAPSAIALNGKYYLFFAANDVQKASTFPGGIGVAVSDAPGGPFKDLLGKPLIGEFYNGAQPIDPMVFRDDDGSLYLYYGGQGHCNVVRLSTNLTHVVPMANGEMYREITPDHYTEGPFMLKRRDTYYLMWSEGDWGDSSYGVAYAKGTSATGPFIPMGKILTSDTAVATGPGHHSVLQIPGTDDWYLVYHRHPLGSHGASRRVMAVEQLRFNAAGNIEPVRITVDGPPARPLSAVR